MIVFIFFFMMLVPSVALAASAGFDASWFADLMPAVVLGAGALAAVVAGATEGQGGTADTTTAGGEGGSTTPAEKAAQAKGDGPGAAPPPPPTGKGAARGTKADTGGDGSIAPEVVARVLAQLGLSSPDEAQALLRLREDQEAQKPDAKLTRENAALAAANQKLAAEAKKARDDAVAAANRVAEFERASAEQRYDQWLDRVSDAILKTGGLVDSPVAREDIRMFLRARMRTEGQGEDAAAVFEDGTVRVASGRGGWTAEEAHKLVETVAQHLGATRPYLKAPRRGGGTTTPFLPPPNGRAKPPAAGDPKLELLASIPRIGAG